MTLRQPVAQLHELQLNGKPQPTSVGDAGQQGRFVGGQRPLGVKFSLDPGLHHVQVHCPLQNEDCQPNVVTLQLRSHWALLA